MKEILKELREKNRYSQLQVSEKLGISRQAYMKYESGEVEPSVESVRRLSKLYGVTYENLINNQAEIFAKKTEYNTTHKSQEVLRVAEPSENSGMTVNYDEFNANALFERLKNTDVLRKMKPSNLIFIKIKIEKILSENRFQFKRTLGGLEKGFWMSDDFDETPDCFKEYLMEEC